MHNAAKMHSKWRPYHSNATMPLATFVLSTSRTPFFFPCASRHDKQGIRFEQRKLTAQGNCSFPGGQACNFMVFASNGMQWLRHNERSARLSCPVPF